MSQEARVLLGIGLVSLLVLFGAVFAFTKSAQSPAGGGSNVEINNPLLVKSDSHQTASSSSSLRVTIVEFGDYQCPACGIAHPIIKQVLSNYSGKVNFVFRNFPLSQHQFAQIAAEAAESAGEQGKFWQMYDRLYETQNDWSGSNQPLDLFTGYAKDLGLDTAKFQNDVVSSKFADKITQDQNDGNSLGVNQTPTFFINGQKLSGVPTYDQLKSIIDSNLSK